MGNEHKKKEYEVYGVKEEERKTIYTKGIKYKYEEIKEELTNGEEYNNFIKERWTKTPREKRIWKEEGEKTKHYIFYD